MASVTFSTTVGGDGSKVTDDSNPATGLDGGGHRTRFVPCLAQTVAVAAYTVGRATVAASFASAAATSASDASSSASAAATSASNAATSASNAATSATNASNSANSAAAAAMVAIAAAFPVGAIYITAGNTNPGTFLGGTWAQIAVGRTLIGVGTLGTDTYAAGNTGGAARVTLTTTEMPSHNHGGATGAASADHTHYFGAGTSTDGSHVHRLINMGYDGTTGSYIDYAAAAGSTSGYDSVEAAGAHAHSVAGWTGGMSANHTHAITAQGDGGAHENRMPYLAVYFWQRTA